MPGILQQKPHGKKLIPHTLYYAFMGEHPFSFCSWNSIYRLFLRGLLVKKFKV